MRRAEPEADSDPTIDARCFCHRCASCSDKSYRRRARCTNCDAAFAVIYRFGDQTRRMDCPSRGVWASVMDLGPA